MLSGVQALRGIAALAVLGTHLGGLWAEQYGRGAPRLLDNGAAGVDLFFVISGLVMALSSAGPRAVGGGTFLRRRVLRIAPMYWLLTLVAVSKIWTVARMPGLGSRADHLPVSVVDLLRSLCFVPYRNSAGALDPVLQVGWTLNFEMFFYLLFALALFARVRPIWMLTPLLAGLALLGLLARPGWPAVAVLMNPLLLEFLAGMYLGRAVQRKTALGPLWLWASLGVLGAAGLVLIPMGNVPFSRVLGWGVPAVLVVEAAVRLDGVLRGRIPRGLLRVGDASYSLYLSHVLVCIAVFRAERVVLPAATIERLGFWPTSVATAAVAVGVGLLLYRRVEKPMTGALARWTGWNRGQAPLPVSEATG